jgi:hypothetical protein
MVVKNNSPITVYSINIIPSRERDCCWSRNLLGSDSLESGKSSRFSFDAEIEGIKFQKIDEGNRRTEISIPIQISEATIEGSTKPKAKRGDGGDDDDEMDGKKKIEMKGKIKGKIATSSGEGSIKGDFEGVFTALVQSPIKGVYLVPPRECSEEGPRSKEQLERRDGRRMVDDKKEGAAEAKGEGGLKRGKVAKFGVYRSSEEARERDARKHLAGTLEAEAAETKAARPAADGTRGRFMREVKGTVSVIGAPTIILELPPLPILDHKCSVVQHLPKRVMKLIKQHDP